MEQGAWKSSPNCSIMKLAFLIFSMLDFNKFEFSCHFYPGAISMFAQSHFSLLTLVISVDKKLRQNRRVQGL